MCNYWAVIPEKLKTKIKNKQDYNRNNKGRFPTERTEQTLQVQTLPAGQGVWPLSPDTRGWNEMEQLSSNDGR